MGNSQPEPKKTINIDDAIIEMKIQSKGILRAAKRAEKQSDKYMKQAKDALKKNKQDFAKLYLTSASQKNTEAKNYQRTALKMELMCDQVKSMKNNETITHSFSLMTQRFSQQMGQIDTLKMYQQMHMFNQQMDEVMINNKMMTEIMNSNQAVDTNVDGMMDVLKQQLAMEESNALIEGGQKQVNENQNKQFIQGKGQKNDVTQ